jgi:NADPH2:quinone reductase
MKAIGYNTKSSDKKLFEKEIEIPEIDTSDLLVRVKAISVNPVDYKVHNSDCDTNEFKILGYDCAGVVEKVGLSVKNFKIGDEVFYSGDLKRQGTNAQYHAVNELLVGKKPQSLTFVEAASLPLVSLAAWEGLFERLLLNELNESKSNDKKNILILGGSGGVGSMATQMAKKIAKLNVIATASKDESKEWCKRMGANLILNHKEDLKKQLTDNNLLEQIDYIFSAADLSLYGGQFLHEIMKPEGHIVSIVEHKKEFDITALQRKSISFSWELMFTKSLFKQNMHTQGEILNKISAFIDNKIIIHPMYKDFGIMNLENLNKVHKILQASKAIGKICLHVD